MAQAGVWLATCLRIIGDNNFPSLNSFFGLSTCSNSSLSSNIYPASPYKYFYPDSAFSWRQMLKSFLSAMLSKEQRLCWVEANNAWHTLAAGVRGLFGIIGRNLRNPPPSVVRTRGQKLLEIGAKILVDFLNIWMDICTKAKQRINKNEIWNKSWPNSCLKRDFGGSRNRLNRVLAFGNLGRISGLGHSSEV